jgi:microcystin-dependent protein
MLYLVVCGLIVAATAEATTVPNLFSSGETVSAMQMNDNFKALQQAIDALVPAGTIVAYGGPSSAIPPGWLLCDGSTISRTTYAALFANIGTSWGGGDSVTTFNLPDLQGRFLRGTDNGKMRDPDAASRATSAPGGNSGDRVGTLQDQAFAAHDHGYSLQTISTTAPTPPNTLVDQYTPGGSRYIIDGKRRSDSAGGNETRPVNASVNYLIKY